MRSVYGLALSNSLMSTLASNALAIFEMAFNYFADQNKEFVQRRRTGRYEECFRKLPDEFKTQQFMDGFGVSQSAAQRSIARLQQDKLIERVKYGVYRKILQELP